MIPAVGLAAGLAAPALLVVVLRRLAEAPKSPGDLGLFAAGAAATFVALVGEDYLWAWLGPPRPTGWGLAVRAFLTIGLVEELAKVGLILGQVPAGPWATWRRYAIAAAWIGAGFAGAENCLYILRHGSGVVIARAFTATPFHVLNTIVAARLLWLGVTRDRAGCVVGALALATFLHGLYDYLIFTDHIGEGKFWLALALTAGAALHLLWRPDETGRRPSESRTPAP